MLARCVRTRDPTTLTDPTGLWPCLSCALEGLGDVVEAVTDAVGGTVEGTFNRAATIVTYEFDVFIRNASNPGQALFDLATGTTLLEQVSAAETIMFDDARLLRDGPYCGSQMECFLGADAFGTADATTMGHTVRFSGTDLPSDPLVAHEAQHVYDNEQLGGYTFYGVYFLSEAACWCYAESFFERRGYYVQENYPAVKPQGIVAQGRTSMYQLAAPVAGAVPQAAANIAGQVVTKMAGSGAVSRGPVAPQPKIGYF